jgi:hypothetical protein
MATKTRTAHARPNLPILFAMVSSFSCKWVGTESVV